MRPEDKGLAARSSEWSSHRPLIASLSRFRPPGATAADSASMTFVLRERAQNQPRSRLKSQRLFLQGEWDADIPISRTAVFYEGIPASAPERWFVVVHRSGHSFAFNECFPGRGGILPCSQSLPQHQAAAVIKRWATPFLLAYVSQEERYFGLTEPEFALPDATIIKAAGGESSGALPTPQPLPPH
jgi:hypothetical protein